MADILGIPPEFDTILVGQMVPGTNHVYGKKRPVPRPALGPFTHHAVQTFAKACSLGQVGLNWRQYLICAQQTWEDLDESDHFSLRKAVERDKKRYADQMKEQAAGAASKEPTLDEKLADTKLTLKKRAVRRGANEFLLEEKMPGTGIAPSAFDLFKDSPDIRSRVYEEKQGPVGYNEFYSDSRWLWGRIEDEEKARWRDEVRRRLDITNEIRRKKGEKELALDTEPGPPEISESKRKRLISAVDKQKPTDSEEQQKEPEEDAQGFQEEAEDEQQESKEAAETKELYPLDLLPWTPTQTQNLSKEERNLLPELLKTVPSTLPRWDREPRAARSAYTLFYGDRLASNHKGENPHSSATRIKIHAEWQAADDSTKKRFEALAAADEAQYQRQREEFYKWPKFLPASLKTRRCDVHKIIDLWHPHTSFEDGQNRAADIPRLGPKSPHQADYGLNPLYYPVIRTDYSNDEVYKHLRHVLLNSEYEGDPTSIDLSFYDGMEPVSLKNEVVPDPGPTLLREDQRGSSREWCKTHLEKKSIDELKTSFGELYFYRKDHKPQYSFGGHGYGVVIDSQSMKDGTVVFLSLNQNDDLDTRPDDDRGTNGAWEQDRHKQWYLAPRVHAADLVIQLVNLDISNVNWNEYVQLNPEDDLDLISDPKSQQWRGWQWAIEYIFGGQALENVVGKVQYLPDESALPNDDEDED